MAITDVKEVEKWLERKDIGHADFYVGEIFQGSYADVYLYLKKVAERFGSRVCIFRNHAKVMAGFGNAFDFCNRKLGQYKHQSAHGADLYNDRYRAGPAFIRSSTMK
mgnify:FL=1